MGLTLGWEIQKLTLGSLFEKVNLRSKNSILTLGSDFIILNWGQATV